MLTDPKEIQIASKAIQKGIRNPLRGRNSFFHIFQDFGIASRIKLNGRYLDLGAGQFDFCEIVRPLGGICIGVDSDPAVIELGKYKGFGSVLSDIRRLGIGSGELVEGSFDGVFCKGSFNAAWYLDQAIFPSELSRLLKPGGWAWLGPWNHLPADGSKDVALEDQRREFIRYGFDVWPLTEEESKWYGVHGMVANYVVFTKNLNWKGIY